MSAIYPGDADLRRLASESHALANSLERIASNLGPTPDDLARAPVIDQWSIVTRPALALAGFATGHPLLGTRPVRTSQLYAISADGLWARTWSRLYVLGRPLNDTQPNH